ncbi:UvrD-helicase domain-containing protein [Photorhabdus sp. SF281]|uniref:UvrD-helicase domain-containing protein n=1 Tax=Photorhabdus sp. SF281 TaxID=3459527 RepID=UPI004044797C
MTSRRINSPDTPADIQLRNCLLAPEKRCFTMVAGAGSGKTTSLVKALATIVSAHGPTLKLNRQRIACITYTEIAVGEIWADVENNPLIHVSTIHSFLWMITRTFQSDIRCWVERRIDERIAELQASAASFGSRIQQKTRDKNSCDIERYQALKPRIKHVPTFNYGAGSNYNKGILGHDDIIRMSTDFLRERPLFRTLLRQQFPFVFVDESQDTQNVVVDALKAITFQAGPTFSLGFFGDPMQRIYPSGVGHILCEDGWELITKEENFRCPSTVLNVANAIRRTGDRLVQYGGRTIDINGERQIVTGSARIFILPADDRRNDFMVAVREWVADVQNDPAWRVGPQEEVKQLVIVHRMAAMRLGFAELYAAMNDKAPSYFGDRFMDASAWPLRPFVSFVLPMVDAVEAGREFEAMTLLREYCPQLDKKALTGKKVAELLGRLRSATHQLVEMMAEGSSATTRDVLVLLRDQQLVVFDPRILNYLEDTFPVVNGEEDEVEGDDLSREITAMATFLACPAREFRGFWCYFREQSPFSTQQGIKGAEFERVLVVLDDDEGTHRQFSYDKYFGVKDLSLQDLKNIKEKKDTSVERTRRLFYVCCTRARKDLVVVYFSTQPLLAEQRIRDTNIFPDDAIFNESMLC